jgi:DNA-binding transcriptional ArsR family regulator
MKHADAVAALAALAQESRLAVYRLLVQSGPEGLPAGQLVESLAIAGPTLSFHLKALSHAGLVTARKQGRFVYYAANFECMDALLGYLTENCCGLGTNCPPVCAPQSRTDRKRKLA